MNNNTPHILLIEDESSLSDVIALNLEMDGYKVKVIDDGAEVLPIFNKGSFDLILLDIMLPNVSGLEICKSVREKDANIPILILSAKDRTADRIKGLQLGADDYLPKPFDLEEMRLRVKALLRRSERLTEYAIFEFGDNTINFETFQAANGNRNFSLTKKEIELLKLLIGKEGEVVSRDEILKQVWGYEVLPNTRTIDNFILSFRKYFEKNPKKPEHFHSVWGVGYRFTAE